MTAADISNWELLTAAILVLLSAGLSLALELNIHRTLLIAAARMVIQLVIVGLFLRQLFELQNLWVTLAVGSIMIGAAVFEVASRQERNFQGAWAHSVGGLPVIVASTGLVLVALFSALKPSPWYDARHLLPLVGLVLGTVMNSASLSLHGVLATVERERDAIEAQLSLGATRFEALHGVARQAIRTGLLSILNQMSAAGIISLPGIMTGQILAGMDPLASATYQILLMFLLATGAIVASIGTVYLAIFRITDDRHRLRLDRLGPPAKRRTKK